MDKKYTDRYDKPIKIGDTVELVDIPLDLFLLRTEPEQNILRAEIGNTHFIQGINQHGKVRLEFYDKNHMPHTIIIDPSCVRRIFG